MVATGCLILTAVTNAPAAYASCGTEGMVSPYAFIGTVINTEKEDRVATVITDSGRQVKVLGTQDTSWFATSFSSVDRRYALAGRYEFHPSMRNRRTGTTDAPQLTNSLVRGCDRWSQRRSSCPAGCPSTNKQALWDTWCSSAQWRQPWRF